MSDLDTDPASPTESTDPPDGTGDAPVEWDGALEDLLADLGSQFAMPDTDDVSEARRLERAAREQARQSRRECAEERHASAWREAVAIAKDILGKAGPRHARMIVNLGHDAQLEGPLLAALVMFARVHLGNTRRQTLFGLVTTLRIDVIDESVTEADGTIDPCSMLYRLVDTAMDAAEDGFPHADAAIRAATGCAQSRHLWDTVAEAVRPPLANGQAIAGSTNEHSALNFTVNAAAPSGRTLTEILAGVDGFVGMTGVKDFALTLAASARFDHACRLQGLRVPPTSRHMVFTGNPGTGKTTVARLVADILHATGTLPGAPFVETDRSGLIGEWLGSTALKTRKMADSALGGVLFIDEAHALAGGDSVQADRFAAEALDTLVKVMEDDRDDLVVILAGYPAGMERLLAMNPGLESRIGQRLHFPDYTDVELLDIFVAMATANGQLVAPDALDPLAVHLAAQRRTDSFGNARLARTIFETAIGARARRLAGDPATDLSHLSRADLTTVHATDITAACRTLTEAATAAVAVSAGFGFA